MTGKDLEQPPYTRRRRHRASEIRPGLAPGPEIETGPERSRTGRLNTKAIRAAPRGPRFGPTRRGFMRWRIYAVVAAIAAVMLASLFFVGDAIDRHFEGPEGLDRLRSYGDWAWLASIG